MINELLDTKFFSLFYFFAIHGTNITENVCANFHFPSVCTNTNAEQTDH